MYYRLGGTSPACSPTRSELVVLLHQSPPQFKRLWYILLTASSYVHTIQCCPSTHIILLITYDHCPQVAELLLVRGLAQIVRHRTDDERSAHYESLMNAEASGKNSKKGLHNKSKEPPAHHYNDVSLPGMAPKAKQYLPFFQRGKHTAVVEFVLSGHRLKVSH